MNAAKRILVVDDEALIGLATCRILTRRGFETKMALSGREALSLLESGYLPDLVLMDIDLGAGLNGPETAKAILERRDIPVIFNSSHTEADVVEKTEGITSYGYIVKSAGETVLVASLKMAFRLHEARSALREREAHYRSLFENRASPVWVEDFSAVKSRLRTLAAACGGDLRAYFGANREELYALASLIKIVDLNKAARDSVDWPPDGPPPPSLGIFLGPEARCFLEDELLAIASGATSFEAEVPYEMAGGMRYYRLRLEAVSGHESEMDRVFAVLQDITEARLLKERLLEASFPGSAHPVGAGDRS